VSRAAERRQAREAGNESGRSRFYVVFGAVAHVGIGVVGYNVSSGLLGDAATAPVEVEGLDDVGRLAELARPVSRGNADASITIVEFGDFQCPSCQAFAQAVKPQLDIAFVDPGEAEFVFYDYPIVSGHPNAFFAARAARCADDQGKFWEYHDELFRQQARWSTQPSPAGAFSDYAETVGLDAGEFDTCLNSDRHAELVTANMALGNRMGVRGTPTVFVNVQGQPTRQAPGFDYQSIAKTIEELLASESDAN
jgi:protein-disulfide isomerase